MSFLDIAQLVQLDAAKQLLINSKLKLWNCYPHDVVYVSTSDSRASPDWKFKMTYLNCMIYLIHRIHIVRMICIHDVLIWGKFKRDQVR